MSHGVAGALAALAAAIRAGAEPEIGELARGVLSWLWSVRCRDDDTRQWPTVIEEPGSGSGWCRGDLGIAAAACAAAAALGDREWIDRATAAARSAFARRDWHAESVALCHGPAGAAHIGQRLFELTEDGAFADGARHACADLLHHLDGADLSLGLLVGKSGIALALRSLVEPTEHAWDRWFLPGVPS
jgi:hypothetical protein